METSKINNSQLVGKIYAETSKVLFLIFRQVGIEEEICHDMVQDVFVRLLGIDVLYEAQVKGLAVKIAYNMRIDYLRHNYYVRESQKNHYDYYLEKQTSHQDVDTKDIERVEMAVIRNMSELDAKVYSLFRFEEKTTQEICETLSIGRRAVESRLYRTRKMVRTTLQKAING